MAATVAHGRRKGQSRGPATINMQLPPEMMAHSAPSDMRRPTEQDLKQVTILSKQDWERIHRQLNKRQMEEERLAQVRMEKERLHQLSKEQTSKWTNTIAGQRQKKLEARKIREAKEEEERKLIDIEEAKFQAQKRKEAIERAKTQQYYQTDRVKGFHGALLLTEVLKEREAQLELKQLKEKAVQGQDKQWLEVAQKDYEESILRDQEAARKRNHKVKENASFQQAQIREHQKLLQREKVEDNIEGDELKKLAVQYDLERKRLEEIRKQEAKILMNDNVNQIQDVKRMREIHQHQEEEEDEECRVFAAAKRKMMKLRAEKEKQLHNEKQERLEAIREKLHAQMQQKMDDEDERIQRALDESEAKRNKEEAEKEGRTRKAQHAMTEHRVQQLEEMERMKKEERKKEMEMLAVKREADAQFARNEAEKSQRKLAEMKRLTDFRMKQMDELKQLAEKSQVEQMAQFAQNEALLAMEEQQFQEYAQKVINHCERGGRNVYPLRKAAREGAGGGLGPQFPGKGGVRPSYMVADNTGVQMPNYQRGTTDEVKHQIYGKNHTANRLGFVW